MTATNQKPNGNEYITPEDWEGLLDWQKNVHWCEWEMRSAYGGKQGRPKYLVTRKGADMILDYLNTARRMRVNSLKYKIDKIVHYAVNDRDVIERPEFIPNMDLADSYESDDEEPEQSAPRNQLRRLRRNNELEEPSEPAQHRPATRSRGSIHPIEISDEESSADSDIEIEQIPADYRSDDEDNEYDYDDGFVVPDDEIY
ncbi:hypothetical protein D6_00230 [Faustovirus]|nr:hypothetical protein D6_00230 [Faustovirus]